MRRHTVLNAFILVTLTSAAFAAPVHLRCEYLENPLGIDKASPRLSWQSDNVERDWRQSAYEILVASSAELLHTGDIEVGFELVELGAQGRGLQRADAGRTAAWHLRRTAGSIARRAR